MLHACLYVHTVALTLHASVSALYADDERPANWEADLATIFTEMNGSLSSAEIDTEMVYAEPSGTKGPDDSNWIVYSNIGSVISYLVSNAQTDVTGLRVGSNGCDTRSFGSQRGPKPSRASLLMELPGIPEVGGLTHTHTHRNTHVRMHAVTHTRTYTSLSSPEMAKAGRVHAFLELPRIPEAGHLHTHAHSRSRPHTTHTQTHTQHCEISATFQGWKLCARPFEDMS